MKIAYLCADQGIPIRGHKGASVHVREMVAALAAQGHDVHIFSPTPGAGNPVTAPLHTISAAGLPASCGRLVRRLPRRHARLDKEVKELTYNLTLYARASAYCAGWQPDMIYERYSLYTLAGLVLARRLGVPHLLEVNAPLRLERARTKGLALPPVAGLVERRLFGATDWVLTVSEALQEYVLEHGGRAARTVVQRNAVDTQRFQPGVGRAAARARLGLEEDAVVVGFAGSLKPWHGTDVLLDAVATLATARGTAGKMRLLIVGEGPQDAPLRARAAALGLSEEVFFTGKVAHETMPALLAAMDIGVAPYLQVPDFYFSPLKLYEYMAAGLAVVASDAGEIATLVRDGESGVLCAPGDVEALARALRRLIDDAPQRARLGTAARHEAERHTWSENARALVRLAAERTPCQGRSTAPITSIREQR